ncbi:hypothetical protein B0T22DRAFT_369547 [Podospora appendiculata]|uniref:Uncharacterized protein n=1 Tax=Podospora appendiculata TaxID=314037 RepID=A0AAE0XLF4_9PEZI|nr:hypothetical protein B0T22DRAFT_369547 [Podospora appendiculata]
MEGSYGNVFPATNSAMAARPPPSSGADAYKVNVSRQKTRKWAEFKPQNYDGGDWGDEYDDDDADADEPDEPPPPPSKPMGPRLPGVPPALRQFQPVGPMPLQVHTQPAPAAVLGRPQQTDTGSPLFSGNASERAVGERTVSSQSSVISPGLRRMSPAPPSAGPSVATRFPLRKSSIGQHDSPDSQPGSTSKPWAEARSASPANATAKSPTTPNKPLPFIRPADIYRRMEEEKERERKSSMDSSSRASLDSGTVGRPAERTDLAAKSQMDSTADQSHPVAGAALEGGVESSRNPRPSLAPVAERKSEYGMEALLASYASDEPGGSFQPASSFREDPELPRIDPTSPKLPDLARMSTFGHDLFSTPSQFMAADAPSLPTIPVYLQASNASQPGFIAPPPPPPGTFVRSPADAPPAHIAASSQMPDLGPVGSAVEADVVFRTVQEGARSGSPPNGSQELAGLSLHQNGGSDVAQPSRYEPVSKQREATSSAEDQRPFRPSLPGGWVSETPTTPGDFLPPTPEPGPAPSPAHAPNQTLTPRALVGRSVESGEVSPMTETDDGSSSAGKSQRPAPDAASDVASELEPKSTPTTATTRDSEITPTAPLNPYRAPREPSGDDEYFRAPPPFGTNSTASSPVKDSDVLREEIMKSLSPMQPSSSFVESNDETTAAYHSAAGAARESSYLGDVYGDYWASSEDKVEQNILASTSSNEPAETLGNSTSSQIELSKDLPAVPADTAIVPSSTPVPGKHMAPEAESAAVTEPGDLRRRFSWEAGSKNNASAELAATELPVEQKALGSELSNMVAAAPTRLESSPERPSSSVARDGGLLSPSAPKPNITPILNLAPSSGISHQVSQATTLQPRLALDVPIEPPSPVSVMSAMQGQAPNNHRLSLAEEKMLSPVGQTPPPEQHPALNEGPQPLQPIPPQPNNLKKRGSINIIPFRQIMEMQSPAERIKHYNETRLQFAAIDTGLDEWLLALMSKHSEHAVLDPSFRIATSGSNAPFDAQQRLQSPVEGQAPPTFFQQANTFPPNLNEGGRLQNHMPMPPPMLHGPSGFGQHSKQVGTKSKELLLAAGKTGKGFGKGLLSKGKSKLRGTGDKVFFNS